MDTKIVGIWTLAVGLACACTAGSTSWVDDLDSIPVGERADGTATTYRVTLDGDGAIRVLDASDELLSFSVLDGRIVADSKGSTLTITTDRVEIAGSDAPHEALDNLGSLGDDAERGDALSDLKNARTDLVAATARALRELSSNESSTEDKDTATAALLEAITMYATTAEAQLGVLVDANQKQAKELATARAAGAIARRTPSAGATCKVIVAINVGYSVFGSESTLQDCELATAAYKTRDNAKLDYDRQEYICRSGTLVSVKGLDREAKERLVRGCVSERLARTVAH